MRTRNIGRRTFVKTGAAAAAVAASGSVGSASGAESVFSLPDITLPIVGSDQRFPVRRVYCVGRNYLEHIRELGNDEREPPFFFAKHRDAIVANGSSIAYPGLTKDFQHELELVVAMKSGGINITADNALSHVFGYGVGLDMTRATCRPHRGRNSSPGRSASRSTSQRRARQSRRRSAPAISPRGGSG